MLLNSSPLRVLRRYTYTPADEAATKRAAGQLDQIIQWANGDLVEAVELYDEMSGSILSNVTIDPEADTAAAQMGEVGNCVLTAIVEKVGFGTRGQTRDKIKWKLQGFAPASSPAPNGRAAKESAAA